MSARPSRLRLIAAFGAGIAAWEAVVHASLLLSRASPTIFGRRIGARVNIVQSVVPAATAVALARFAFARPRPPMLFRLVARLLLRDELGPALRQVFARADRHYATLAPRITMAVTPAGRFELSLSAYLLALHRALGEQGVPEERAIAMLSAALYQVMRRWWRVVDLVVPPVLPTASRARLQVALARGLAFREPDWRMREVPSDDGFALDVTRCVARDFFAVEGAAKFCDRVMCEQDVLIARARGIPFTRTETLARGDVRCDFRFG